LLLEDAGVDFEYKRIDFPDWPSTKQNLIHSGDRIPTLPYLTTKTGNLYGRAAPLMRKISKELGKYIPTNAEDEYLADSYSDLYLDWRTKWIDASIFNPNNEKVQETYTKECDFQYANWNNILGDKGGPYVLGQEIAYVDFMLYALLKDDCELKIDEKKYPHIAKFVKAFEARPSLQSYFAKI
jgi:glutathione S-transferase